MTEEPEETQAKEAGSSGPAALPVTRGWGQQMLGALVGALAMAVAIQLGPSLGWQPGDRTSLLLIGAAVGAGLFTLERFAQAGSRLTRRSEGLGMRALNILVALLGMALMAGLIMGLASLVIWLFRQF